MTCPECAKFVERPDLPHVIRACPGCGRNLHIQERGEHGIGLKIREGDQFVIPAGWLKFSFNPLKSTGQFTRYGLQEFAKQIHIGDLPTRKEGVGDEIARMEMEIEHFLKQSPLLVGLKLEDESDAEKITSLLTQNRDSAEYLSMAVGVHLSVARESMTNGDIGQAVWAMACAERFRSMLIFKQHLEEVVWMGQSAKRVVDILGVWEGNQTNDDEAFWQVTFTQNAYALSQVFAVPVVFVKESAYVGGMNIDRANAKLVDYLLTIESSREAVLVEIKTPVTKLASGKYRGTYRPSTELTGAIMQVLDYRRSLVRNLASLAEGTEHKLSAFSPLCVVVIGNGAKELDNDDKRAAFELFRANSRDVEIVTYDELFRKVELLAALFSLTRPKPAQPTSLS